MKPDTTSNPTVTLSGLSISLPLLKAPPAKPTLAHTNMQGTLIINNKTLETAKAIATASVVPV